MPTTGDSRRPNIKIAPMATTNRSEEFMNLLAEGQARVLGYIYALVQNMNDAEDVYQNVCLVLWRKFDQYQPGTDFVRWAISTAHFEAANFLRGQRGRRLAFSDAFLEQMAVDEPAALADDDRRIAALQHCMESLRDRDRAMIDRRYGEHASVKQMAAESGRSPQSVANTLSRIRVALLRCIERSLAEEDES